MTAHDDTTALWMFGELWGLPRDVGTAKSRPSRRAGSNWHSRDRW